MSQETLERAKMAQTLSRISDARIRLSRVVLKAEQDFDFATEIAGRARTQGDAQKGLVGAREVIAALQGEVNAFAKELGTD